MENPVVWALSPALQAAGLFVVWTTIWPRPTAVSRTLFVVVDLSLLAHYMWWRVTQTLPEPGLSGDFVYALVFMLVEFTGMIATGLAIFFLSRTRDRSADADANADWLEKVAKHPPVDVLICSYNEEQAIVERTIVGAQAMTYPNFRVWMLDDSRRDWLKDLCATLNCGYIARPSNEHAKAGNLNNALRILAETAGPAAVRLDPRRRFRADAALSEPRDGAVSRRDDRHRADAAAFHQPGPDPVQPRGCANLARRTAVFLRRRAAGQGRLEGGDLLRNLLGRAV